MTKEIIHCMQKYLNNQMNITEFSDACRDFYVRVLHNKECGFELDAIIWIPFIHEFGYCDYTDLELKTEVEHLVGVLLGKKDYNYSSFFKLIPPAPSDKRFYDLYLKYPDIKIDDLDNLFISRIDSPNNLKDCIQNYIVDILENINFDRVEDSLMDCVNMGEGISLEFAKEKLYSFLAYYLGVSPFYLNISVFKDGKTVYLIH